MLTGRSREGAWIEIYKQNLANAEKQVAPARERGLKCAEFGNDPRQLRRSREGAWIEIPHKIPLYCCLLRRSREGAWIEIPTLEKLWPYGYSRSREGAWIEISIISGALSNSAASLPRGSVD